MTEYFVYMLRCRDGTYYIGVTNDWERRIVEHQDGLIAKAYTHHRRPLDLVYLATFSEITDAIAWEKQLKKWSRKKKEALIHGEQEKLQQYSKRYSHYVKNKANPLCHPEGSRSGAIVTKGRHRCQP